MLWISLVSKAVITEWIRRWQCIFPVLTFTVISKALGPAATWFFDSASVNSFCLGQCHNSASGGHPLPVPGLSLGLSGQKGCVTFRIVLFVYFPRDYSQSSGLFSAPGLSHLWTVVAPATPSAKCRLHPQKQSVPAAPVHGCPSAGRWPSQPHLTSTGPCGPHGPTSRSAPRFP